MHGSLDPEERILTESSWIDQLHKTLTTLKWEHGDNIAVEIGGTSVSGIDVGEEYNKKWQSPKGTRKYNKDAFIVIKNLDRNTFEPSQPNPELKQHHAE
jgi:hypothetical protein|tara:strand:+ start:26 stop:322 length:297 start_codon:yes stop_codon:yes gene_type:complete